MADIWLDVDAAVTVFVNLVPLTDDTDFKSVEDAVPYNASGMDIRWHFSTSAGVITSTAITPTTGGDYDWTHVGDGIYKLEIPASGGASANNDIEGHGFISGKITGVLHFRGPIYGFRAAALNDALIDGGDNLDVNVTQWLGTAAATPTVAGVPEVDLTHVAGATTDVSALATNVAAVLVDTGTTLDGRIPAALSGGNMKSDVLAINGSTAGAANLSRSSLALYRGSVTGAATTTTLIDSGLTEADVDHWKGRIVIFTTGALAKQATDITAFDPALDKLTFTALTNAPSGADEYVIV